ncbi:MAG: GNAT family N-acetyltransferase [Tyzzerella sp.]|nr:GNAT family N-acetyltransferase [Tyzzerella sp.]
MELRKLIQEEHIKTRKLWEEIFTEDTPEFLDYYYSVKTKDNEIYVIEEDDKIVSMLHLNPYQMRIGKQVYHTHYIVAVATDENYRKRGYMAALLKHVVRVMTDRGEPFTFLMPAAEAIYKPFGFEFIYEQKRGKIKGRRNLDKSLEVVEATEENCGEIADFANDFLKEYDVVTWRDVSYYKTLLAEQASENGGILLAKQNGQLEGVFCYAISEAEDGENASDKHFEIREPLCRQKEDLEHIIWFLTGNENESVFCTGYGEETRPMIMAKVLHPELTGDLKTTNVFLNEVV